MAKHIVSKWYIISENTCLKSPVTPGYNQYFSSNLLIQLFK